MARKSSRRKSSGRNQLVLGREPRDNAPTSESRFSFRCLSTPVISVPLFVSNHVEWTGNRVKSISLFFQSAFFDRLFSLELYQITANLPPAQIVSHRNFIDFNIISPLIVFHEQRQRKDRLRHLFYNIIDARTRERKKLTARCVTHSCKIVGFFLFSSSSGCELDTFLLILAIGFFRLPEALRSADFLIILKLVQTV